jgi:hypothetical protein
MAAQPAERRRVPHAAAYRISRSASIGHARLAPYRKYGPATFAEVNGQQHLTGPSQQLLRNGRIHHSSLLNGRRGRAKIFSARILAGHSAAPKPTPDPCRAMRILCRARPTRRGQISGNSQAGRSPANPLFIIAEPALNRLRCLLASATGQPSTTAIKAHRRKLASPLRGSLWTAEYT